MLAAPRNMPPIEHQERQRHSSDYGVRTNHPTSYDDNPSFKGPLVLEEMGSPDYYRSRIRVHFLGDEELSKTIPDKGIKTSSVQLSASSSTATIIKTIVEHLARKNAPVDVKEVAESTEFYLRTGKRLFGAARRILKNEMKGNEGSGTNTIVIHDLCSGHGLTGLMFVACNPPRGKSSEVVRAVLVDQSKPQSHDVLRDIISEICPWVTSDSVQFTASSLDEFISNKINAEDYTPIVISTHACGSLTDNVLSYAVDRKACAVAVMPCCYTGTDNGVPYGLRRVLGVGLAADTRRSFHLQDNGYHVDFAAIPKTITPMNRIIVAEKRK